MSVIAEVIPIEGIDTEGAPPCEIYYMRKPCPNPAAARVILPACVTCGRTRGARFACKRCLDGILAGWGECLTCGSPMSICGYC